MSRIRDPAAVQRKREKNARLMHQFFSPTPAPPPTQPEQRAMTAKAKVHSVTLPSGERHLVMAHTKAGALRGLRDHVLGEAVVDLATGEEIFDAGVEGRSIIDRDKFRVATDPNQIPLEGVPETASNDAKPNTPF
jgi:hypothetical protein